MVSDYYNLTNRLLKLAKDNNIPQEKIDVILNDNGKSLHRDGKSRPYRSLLEDRFDITKIIRIERSADENDIANKWCDFSLGTVSNLFEQGKNDARRTLQNK